MCSTVSLSENALDTARVDFTKLLSGNTVDDTEAGAPHLKEDSSELLLRSSDEEGNSQVSVSSVSKSEEGVDDIFVSAVVTVL